MSGAQSPLGESRNSKQNLYHSKNVSNPVHTQGLGVGVESGRSTGLKRPVNNNARPYGRLDNDGADPQDNIDIDVGNDDYDEETDEFANYSQQQHVQHVGDGMSNQQSNMGMPTGCSFRLDIDVGNDDYDEETDEFANYSQQQHVQHVGDGMSNQQSNMGMPTGKNEAGPQTGQSQPGQSNPQLSSMNQSIKSNSSKGKKSQAQRDREKNIKEVKMYYWTKVDQGDRTEVVKILTFAKQNFNQENEMNEIVNCTNSDGFTPLHLASSEGHAPLIEILIKFGA